MLVLAHRGYSSRAPENTMAAFRLALEAGADGLELDVQLTRDGEAVVIHDFTLDRTTDGSGFVAQYTLAELRQFDAGGWFAPEFAGESIPTLAEVCELVKEWKVLLNVELKAGLGFETLNERLIDILIQYGIEEHTIVSSFNHYALAHLKQLRPEIRTGILYNAALVNPWVYAQSIGASAVHPYYLGVIPEIVQGAQRNGMMVNTWTVNEPADIQRTIAAQVDSIITDKPGLVLEILKQTNTD
jgi:glycerophosphoryl diester phosphodiesterase